MYDQKTEQDINYGSVTDWLVKIRGSGYSWGQYKCFNFSNICTSICTSISTSDKASDTRVLPIVLVV